MERVITLEHQVLTLRDKLSVVTEVLVDQGISSESEIKSRSEKIRREVGFDLETLERDHEEAASGNKDPVPPP